MERRKFTREFKLEAVRLIRERGVSYAQASQDLSVHQSQLRNWVKALADDPQHAFPGQGQMKPEQLEIARSGNVWDNAAMESFFSSLKTERTRAKPIGRVTKPKPMCSTTLNASIIRNVGTRRSDI
jgi:transposase